MPSIPRVSQFQAIGEIQLHVSNARPSYIGVHGLTFLDTCRIQCNRTLTGKTKNQISNYDTALRSVFIDFTQVVKSRKEDRSELWRYSTRCLGHESQGGEPSRKTGKC